MEQVFFGQKIMDKTRKNFIMHKALHFFARKGNVRTLEDFYIYS